VCQIWKLGKRFHEFVASELGLSQRKPAKIDPTRRSFGGGLQGFGNAADVAIDGTEVFDLCEASKCPPKEPFMKFNSIRAIPHIAGTEDKSCEGASDILR
jgi:hypothetical protein